MNIYCGNIVGNHILSNEPGDEMPVREPSSTVRPIEPQSQTIGQKLRAARRAQGLSQAQLAKDLVTPSMISQIEADRTKPSSGLLSSLASRLGIPVEYFLNTLDEQFIFQTYLRQAEYELLLDGPEAALHFLAKAASVEMRGHAKQQHNLLTARAYRLQYKYVEAADLLEECRQYAYRTRDLLLQFHVNQESGYLEYAMNNDLGAIGEWQKALEIGEALTNGLPGHDFLMLNRFHLSLKMAESLTSLHRFAEAQQVLEGALEAGKNLGKLRGVAETFRANSQFWMAEGKSNEAKEWIDRAVTVIQSAKLSVAYTAAQAKLLYLKDLSHPTSEQRETARALMRNPAGEPMAERADSVIDDLDLWKQSALAVLTTDPRPFIDAELILIERYLSHKEVSPAERRIQRCLDILEDYCGANPELENLTHPQRYKLWMAHARVAYLQGKLALAITRAEQVRSGMAQTTQDFEDRDLNSSYLAQILKQLIEWYGEAGVNEKVLELSKQLKNLLEPGFDWTKFLV